MISPWFITYLESFFARGANTHSLPSLVCWQLPHLLLVYPSYTPYISSYNIYIDDINNTSCPRWAHWYTSISLNAYMYVHVFIYFRKINHCINYMHWPFVYAIEGPNLCTKNYLLLLCQHSNIGFNSHLPRISFFVVLFARKAKYVADIINMRQKILLLPDKSVVMGNIRSHDKF
jgi:hypothetical protein